MKSDEAGSITVAPEDVGEALRAVRLSSPQVQREMQLSLARLGQLTPVQVYRAGEGLELFDGFKRVQAARELSWPKVRAEVHKLSAAGAKVRLWRCNAAGAGLSELEEAWLVRSLYREDKLSQPHIAQLLGHDKSWVCRRLMLAEGLTDGLVANVRLGLLCARAAVDLSRLPRGNQDTVAEVVIRRGLSTRQTSGLVEALLAAPEHEWPKLLEQCWQPVADKGPKGGAPRRTPGEQLMADAWAMKRLAARLHARLLERSLPSFGSLACTSVSRELAELRAALVALSSTLDARLGEQGGTCASA